MSLANASRVEPEGTGIGQLKAALAESRKGFEIKQIPVAAAQGDWSLVDGAFQHRSRGFFSITCVEEPGGAERVGLYQPQGAVNGLYSAKRDGQRQFLVQARAEPGNVNIAQIGPSLQSTPANFLRFHGGRTSDFFGFFLQHDPDIRLLEEMTQLDLGKIYFLKTKRTIFAEGHGDVEVPDGFLWVSRDTFLEAVRESYTLNTDMRAFLSVLPWSADPSSGEIGPVDKNLQKSLAAEIRPERIGALMQKLSRPQVRNIRFKPLDQLKNWRLTENGLEEIAPRQNIAAYFYQTQAQKREMKSWLQPMLTSQAVGDFGLLTRERHGVIEVYVRPHAEIGVASGHSLCPSWLFYPGEDLAYPDWMVPHLEDVWLSTDESDEGGRFYHHKSRVSICRVNPDAPAGWESEDGWLRLSELQVFLRRSNTCSIQLRIAASLLLGLRS
ncbi:MAG: NDP-hexose 2,3-dehydratase family protein [Mangrovicoccus sp.]|nr:NDP-hexose 2,3-dehydratase family protein [Mangrovicoccus sp.]